MKRYFYTPSIVIVDQVGVELSNATTMSLNDWSSFQKLAVGLLDALRSTSPGTTLLNAMGRTGKVAYLFSAPAQGPGGPTDNNGTDTSCRVFPLVTNSMFKAMVKSFRPAQKNFSYVQKDSPDTKRRNAATHARYNNEPDLTAAKRADLLQQVQAANLPTTRQATAPELMRVLARCRAGQSLTPRLTTTSLSNPETQIPRLLNITEELFNNMCQGNVSIKDDQYYLMCCYLYDFLEAGPGTDVQVRVMQESKFNSFLAADVKEESSIFRSNDSTERRVKSAVIGHELIHAWRSMAGRRLVTDGWEEEAMTSGIGPFSSWLLTENTFRAALGLSSRKKYMCNGISSGAFATLRQTTNSSAKSGVHF